MKSSNNNRRRLLRMMGLAGAAFGAAWHKLVPEAAAQAAGMQGSTAGAGASNVSADWAIRDLSEAEITTYLRAAQTNNDVTKLLSMLRGNLMERPATMARQAVGEGLELDTVFVPYADPLNLMKPGAYLMLGHLRFLTGEARDKVLPLTGVVLADGTAYGALFDQVRRFEPEQEAAAYQSLFGGQAPPTAPIGPMPSTLRKPDGRARMTRAWWRHARQVDTCPFDWRTGLPRPGDPQPFPPFKDVEAECSVPCGAWAPFAVACGVIVVGCAVSVYMHWIALGIPTLVCAGAAAVVCLGAAGWYFACQNCRADRQEYNRAICGQWLLKNPGA